MKLSEVKRPKNTVEFSELQPGDVFKCDSYFYMKTKNMLNSNHNGVSLSDYRIVQF